MERFLCVNLGVPHSPPAIEWHRVKPSRLSQYSASRSVESEKGGGAHRDRWWHTQKVGTQGGIGREGLGVMACVV